MVLQDRCLIIQGTLWSYKTGVLLSREHYGVTMIQGTLWSYKTSVLLTQESCNLGIIGVL